MNFDQNWPIFGSKNPPPDTPPPELEDQIHPLDPPWKKSHSLPLDLTIYRYVPISEKFFKIFNLFKALKKLRIELSQNKVLSGSIECFKHCKQLIDLDITYTELREDFFANIASFVPKLQSLRIRTVKNFSDSFIDSLQSMENIQNVFVWRYNREHKFWYFGKCLSEVMLSPNGMNVIRVNDNCGLIKCKNA